MRYKKIMILTIILTCLLAVSAVSAADNTTDDIISTDASEDVANVSVNDATDTSVSSNNNDLISIENENIIKINNESDVLEENNSIRTFSDLSDKINKGQSEIVFDCDYKYNASIDSNYQTGVLINKQISIDGKGHIIDGNGEAKLLRVFGNNVTLKNIIFTNIYSSSSQTDAAVRWGGSRGLLENCSFVNISVKYGTSALSIDSHSIIKNCYFVNNNARTNGVTISMGNNNYVVDCIFINNSGEYGAAICSHSSENYIVNSVFLNNSASSSGGAIYFGSIGGNKNTLLNCSFTYNSVKEFGGAVCCYGSEINLTNCTFNNNYALSWSGGAVMLGGNDGILTNCHFFNNSAGTGGAIQCSATDCILTNCSFVNNHADSSGAISSFYDECTLKECIFINNSAFSCGALRFIGDNNNLEKCIFVNNSAGNTGAVSLESSRNILKNCSFVNNHAKRNGGAIYGINIGGKIYNSSFVNNYVLSNNGGAIYLSATEYEIVGCSFINNSVPASKYEGGAIFLKGKLDKVINCSFINNSAYGGSAISLYDNNSVITDCLFINNSAYGAAGAIYLPGQECNLINCSFIKNNATQLAGGIFLVGNTNFIINCNFKNNSAPNGGSIFWKGDSGTLANSSFLDNFASENGGAVYWYGDNGNLTNCVIIDNINSNQVYWGNSENGTIANCKFLNNTNSVINRGANFIKRNVNLTSTDCTFDYKHPKIISIELLNALEDLPIYSSILFEFNKENDVKNFTTKLNNNVTSLLTELTDLNGGNWSVTAIFEGDDNYYPTNTTFTLTINPLNSSLVIKGANTTLGHEIIIKTIVENDYNFTIDSDFVTFYDNGINIGNSTIHNNTASLSYIPTTAGEHTITALYSSDNYLNSSNMVKILVDTATIELLTDNGCVGYNSTFIANVKGLYSTINEGTVTFYINDDYLDKVKVINGSASITNTFLTSYNYVIKAVYSGNDNFLDVENSTTFIVSKADTKVTIVDSTGTVDHKSIITTNITSSNNLIIDEGSVTFYDDNTEIGLSYVNNGVAILEYTPTTVGEHIISAAYWGMNYLSSNASSKMIVNKANSNIVFNEMGNVYYNQPTTFTVKVLSDDNNIQEGNVKFYINNIELEQQKVTDGVISVEYLPEDVGDFNISAIFAENDKYLSSNASYIFTVNKLPTAITASGITVAYNSGKYIVATLKDSYGNPLKNVKVTVKIGTKTLTPTTDKNGQVKISTDSLAPVKLYTVAITFAGNSKYEKSTKSVKVSVVKANLKVTPTIKKYKANVKPKKYYVTVKNSKNQKLKNIKVSIIVKGRTFSAYTLKNGVATLKVTNLLKKGTYKAYVSFAGSKYYNKLTKKVYITVK